VGEREGERERGEWEREREKEREYRVCDEMWNMWTSTDTLTSFAAAAAVAAAAAAAVFELCGWELMDGVREASTLSSLSFLSGKRGGFLNFLISNILREKKSGHVNI